MAKAIGRSPVIQALQLTALFVGGAILQQKQSHNLCECVALDEFKCHHPGKVLWNQMTVMRFHCVRYCTLSEVQNCWQNKAGGDTQ
jgi:hypothetical protein